MIEILILIPVKVIQNVFKIFSKKKVLYKSYDAVFKFKFMILLKIAIDFLMRVSERRRQLGRGNCEFLIK